MSERVLLPQHIKIEHYELELIPDETIFLFKCNEKINMNVLLNTK